MADIENIKQAILGLLGDYERGLPVYATSSQLRDILSKRINMDDVNRDEFCLAAAEVCAEIGGKAFVSGWVFGRGVKPGKSLEEMLVILFRQWDLVRDTHRPPTPEDLQGKLWDEWLADHSIQEIRDVLSGLELAGKAKPIESQGCKGWALADPADDQPTIVGA